MKIIVFSDIHLSAYNAEQILNKHKDDADLFIFLGDGESKLEELLMLYPDIRIEQVAGNCDFSSKNPNEKIITVCGKKIFFTHGHMYYVKHGIERLVQRAKEINASLVLYGHTHMEYEAYEDGLYILNPGAVANNRYAVVEVNEQGIVTNLMKI